MVGRERQSGVPFIAHEYGDGDGREAVALVTGFIGTKVQLEQAATDLANTGRDTVIYTYDKDVLLAGNGALLPALSNTLNDDFARRMPDYDQYRYCGVSLGGAVASTMQKNHPAPERGLYAATGIDAADLVLRNPFFRAVILASHRVDIRRIYEKNGYTYADLADEWHELQQSPKTPCTIALGGLDYIVHHRRMLRKIEEWRAENRDVRVIRKPWLGHTGTIKWFNQNILSMLEPLDNQPKEFFYEDRAA